MAPILATAVSGTLERAYCAALLLTGSAELSEVAVLNGIAGFELGDDIDSALVAKTVEFVIRRPDYKNRWEASALPPHDELRWLIHVTADSRDCFLLRVLFGIPTASCAAILNLTIEELQASVSAAARGISVLGRTDLINGTHTSNTGEQK